MISRVPYPSFKTITVHKRAPIELTIGVLMAAAMLFAMPQLTAFILAAQLCAFGAIFDVAWRRDASQGPGPTSGAAAKGKDATHSSADQA